MTAQVMNSSTEVPVSPKFRLSISIIALIQVCTTAIWLAGYSRSVVDLIFGLLWGNIWSLIPLLFHRFAKTKSALISIYIPGGAFFVSAIITTFVFAAFVVEWYLRRSAEGSALVLLALPVMCFQGWVVGAIAGIVAHAIQGGGPKFHLALQFIRRWRKQT